MIEITPQKTPGKSWDRKFVKNRNPKQGYKCAITVNTRGQGPNHRKARVDLGIRQSDWQMPPKLLLREPMSPQYRVGGVATEYYRGHGDNLTAPPLQQGQRPHSPSIYDPQYLTPTDLPPSPRERGFSRNHNQHMAYQSQLPTQIPYARDLRGPPPYRKTSPSIYTADSSDPGSATREYSVESPRSTSSRSSSGTGTVYSFDVEYVRKPKYRSTPSSGYYSDDDFDRGRNGVGRTRLRATVRRDRSRNGRSEWDDDWSSYDRPSKSQHRTARNDADHISLEKDYEHITPTYYPHYSPDTNSFQHRRHWEDQRTFEDLGDMDETGAYHGGSWQGYDRRFYH